MILPGNHEKTLPIIIYEEMKGTICIRGRSISTEVEEYFADFLPYLQDNLTKNPMNMSVNVDLEYFNTRTARLLMSFFYIIKQYVYDKGYNADITWIIEEGDDDIQSAAEDYSIISKMEFKYVYKPEED